MFNAYFSEISQLVRAERIRTDTRSPAPYFPQMMVITTMPNHFAVELVGGERFNGPLRLVQRKLNDADIYFGQFKYPSGIPFAYRFTDSLQGKVHEGPVFNLDNLAMIPAGTHHEVARRFPKILSHYGTIFTMAGNARFTSITFSNKRTRVTVNNVLLANFYNGITRIRHIQLAVVISKSTLADDYKSYLKQLLSVTSATRLVAVRLYPASKEEVIFKAAQFANIFLMNNLHETSIGAFIDQHREILLSALNVRDLISEPYLPWVIPSPDPQEKAINPDLFVQREDGYWDICDLKLPLLDRKDVTRGNRNRIRFLSTIEDGIAQLAHYREFLAIPEHAALAAKKYGVKFSNPRLALVVGNYENVDIGKIADAKRRFPDIEIIDYDSLLQIYLINNDALPRI